MSARGELGYVEGMVLATEESGGAMTVTLIRPQNWPGLIGKYQSGDPQAAAQIRHILNVAARVKNTTKEKPALCLVCQQPLGDPFPTIILLAPRRDNPTVAIESALCPKCSLGTANEIFERAAVAFQAVWPDVRCIDGVTHPEGLA